MKRIAVVVVAMQVAFVALTWLAAPPPEPSATSFEKLLAAGLPVEQCRIDSLERYGRPCIDLHATMTGSRRPRELRVSVRPWTEPDDYECRRAWDARVACQVDPRHYAVQDEGIPAESGYCARFAGRDGS